MKIRKSKLDQQKAQNFKSEEKKETKEVKKEKKFKEEKQLKNFTAGYSSNRNLNKQIKFERKNENQ